MLERSLRFEWGFTKTKWRRGMEQPAPYSCRNNAEKLVGSASECVLLFQNLELSLGEGCPATNCSSQTHILWLYSYQWEVSLRDVCPFWASILKSFFFSHCFYLGYEKNLRTPVNGISLGPDLPRGETSPGVQEHTHFTVSWIQIKLYFVEPLIFCDL